MKNCPHCGESLDAPLKIEGTHTTVAAPRLLIVGNRTEVKEKILAAGPYVVLDLVGTTYIDSAGLGMMCSASKQLRARRGELRVANVSEDLRTLFDLVKVWHFFPELEPVAP